MFCEQESSAARAESHEENDWMMEDVNDDDFDEDSDKPPTNENLANFNRALHKAAGHMENTFDAAFTGVILAVILLRDRTAYISQIRELMPQKKFDTMAFILKKFFVFMHMSVCRQLDLENCLNDRYVNLIFSMHLHRPV